MQTFADLLTALSRHEVKYLLVGGLAVELCGYSRVTHDVDILVEYTPDNLDRLLRCLLAFGEGAARELSVGDFDLEEGCVRVIEDFPLDIFTVMRGQTYQDLLRYAEKWPLGDTEIPYLNAEGLIALKRESPRPKDRMDARVLENLRHGKNPEDA